MLNHLYHVKSYKCPFLNASMDHAFSHNSWTSFQGAGQNAEVAGERGYTGRMLRRESVDLRGRNYYRETSAGLHSRSVKDRTACLIL